MPVSRSFINPGSVPMPMGIMHNQHSRESPETKKIHFTRPNGSMNPHMMARRGNFQNANISEIKPFDPKMESAKV